MIDFVTMRQCKIQGNREYRIKIVEVMEKGADTE